MRVGLVCPYSFEVPGGVQNHVRGLSESLRSEGCDVSVLAPAGRSVPVPYNGSVARLTFGPLSMARTRRWLRAGDFDVLHVHEPTTPSVSLLALWAAECPSVATFHTATARSRALTASAGIVRPAMAKLSVRIAVSEPARATLAAHTSGANVVIPNGVYVDRFAAAMPDPRFRNAAGTVVFLGRFDEPRKGLDVLLRAFAEIAGARPGVRLLVAGRGEAGPLRGLIPRQHRQAVRFLGVLDDHTKARLLASADVFVAPNSGGESCGLVLLEAMAAGVPVVASDIEAFDLVCEGGRLGALFPNGSPGGLADAVLSGLGGDCARARAKAAQVAVRRYDWATVTRQILDVYERVVAEPHARAGA